MIKQKTKNYTAHYFIYGSGKECNLRKTSISWLLSMGWDILRDNNTTSWSGRPAPRAGTRNTPDEGSRTRTPSISCGWTARIFLRQSSMSRRGRFRKNTGTSSLYNR